MEFIRGLNNLRPRHRGCVASIGNYDGVHRGHQVVIRQLLQRSRDLGVPALVMTFEPHPQEHFAGASAPPRLSSLRDKLRLLADLGVHRVLCLRFDARLARMPAQEFVAQILAAGVDVRYLVVGDDFRFGRGREGDFDLLAVQGERLGFTVARTQTHVVGGDRVSSTRIRTLLAQGDFNGAAELLGRPYAISGRVTYGDQRGREWGFPTANVRLSVSKPPITGTFAVAVYDLGAEPVYGVANLGTRPTVDGTRTLLEVHLLDFSDTIYGRRIRVDFLAKLRDERRFESAAALREQIARDRDAARAYVARRNATGAA